MFAASHTTLDLGMCTIVIGVLQIVGNYATTLLCDKYGRRILMLTSTAGAAICLVAFGCYTYYAQEYDLSSVGWLPLVILSFYVFLCNIGMVGCMFVVLVELFPSKVGPSNLLFMECSIYMFLNCRSDPWPSPPLW